MFLCFGTYANILKLCCVKGTTDKMLVSALVGTIDPDNKYDDEYSDTPVSRLMNCGRNFPVVAVEAHDGAIRSNGGSLTNIIALANKATPADVEANFDTVIGLLAEDKKNAAVGALHHLIENDETLEKENRSLFVSCLGDTAANVITAEYIDLKSLLARLFLYTARLNKNTAGRSSLHEIKTKGFIDRFAAYAFVIREEHSSYGSANASIPEGERLYMKKLKDKYNCLPTILYDDAFTPFRDYYVPNNVDWHERLPGKTFTFRVNVLPNITLPEMMDVSRFIVLSGTGGLGKSMMMRNLILSAVDEYDNLCRIPLFVTLKDYEISYPTLVDYIFDMVHNLWSGLTVEGLVSLLHTGKALLLLDGLDEISTKNLTHFTKQLNDFIDCFSNNTFIISSRPYSNFSSFTRFTVLHLRPFTLEQALELVDRFNYRSDAPKLQERFRALLESKLYYSHKGFSDNPLLLSIMLLTFEMDAEVPTVKYIFYQEAYAVLSKRHDATKDGYTRKMKTGWSSAEFARYFSFFCAFTYRQGKISFNYTDLETYFSEVSKKYNLSSSITVDDFIYDAINSLCIMYQDGLNYGFIHRSFQEYFCAKFFHGQLDESLKKIIPIFNRDDTTKMDDMTLPMLFDMKPQAVEKYLIVPYLEKFISSCEEANGLWTFLGLIYPDYEVADGEAYPDDDTQIPKSNLYAFIIDHYNIPLINIDPEQFDNIYLAETAQMVYREDTHEDDWRGNLPFDYEDDYEEPTVTGSLYTFNWDKIYSSSIYKELKQSIESDDSPFMKEYQSIKQLLNGLHEKINNQSASADPFENMF